MIGDSRVSKTLKGLSQRKLTKNTLSQMDNDIFKITCQKYQWNRMQYIFFNPNIEIEYRFFSDFILNLCWIQS